MKINSSFDSCNSPLGLHSADLANFGHCADFSLALRPKFTKNYESQTENPSVVDSAHSAESSENQFARSANLCKSFCYFWLLPKVESPLPLNSDLPSNEQISELKKYECTF